MMILKKQINKQTKKKSVLLQEVYTVLCAMCPFILNTELTQGLVVQIKYLFTVS